MILTPQKRWQFLSLLSDDAFVSCAIVDFGYLGFSFGYAFHRRLQETRYYQKIVPCALNTQVSSAPWTGDSSFSHRGIRAQYKHQTGKVRVECPGFQAEGILERGAPWEMGWPLSGGQTRTSKMMGVPTQGTLYWDDECLSLEGNGLFDWTCGRMPWETSWKWSAGMGLWGDRLISWNLRTGFEDPYQVENAIWLDGRPYHPGLCRIEVGKPWDISTEELQLTFHPQGERAENLNLGLIASRYHQPWGLYHGTFRGLPIQGFGVAEDHWARW